MKSLRVPIIAAIAALGLTAASNASAGAAPELITANADGASAQLDPGVYNPAAPVALEQSQFIIGAQNYCWYPGGWRGPGFYWCGYAWRRGFGWGGGYGWNGWGGGYPAGWRGGYWHGAWSGARGPGYRPGWNGGWRGGAGGGYNRSVNINRNVNVNRRVNVNRNVNVNRGGGRPGGDHRHP